MVMSGTAIVIISNCNWNDGGKLKRAAFVHNVDCGKKDN